MPFDKYNSFEKLSASERPGVDYEIHCVARPSQVAIIAPHGRQIEPGTAEIAAAIANDSYSFYCFNGLRHRPHGHLHITSSNFDEPQCLGLLSTCKIVVAIHGCRNLSVSSRNYVYLGGLNRSLKETIFDCLRDAGFDVRNYDDRFPGEHRSNICNRGLTGQGAQLEVSRGLREEFLNSSEKLSGFAKAVRTGIDDALRGPPVNR